MNSHDRALPVTTLLPESAAEPVVLFDQHVALRFAIVERDHAMKISAEEWDRARGLRLARLPERGRLLGVLRRKGPRRNPHPAT